MQKNNRMTGKVAGESSNPMNMRFARIEYFIFVLGWAVLTFMLAYANRHFVGVELNEVADFAANSLLIQDAKHLQLWVGHYSRIGFNHPGPFLLYVLAAGEWLLFDSLHLVKSPLAGQIFAASALNAWWLILIARLLFRVERSLPSALASWIAIIAVTAYVDHNFLSGLWFPHLFFWPFATFCLALTRLAAGKNDSLIALALSCGALVHGHVSFVAICGIMLAGTAVLNCVQRNDDSKNSLRLCSVSSIRRNRRILLLPVIILISFFVPLVVETVKHFPGPLQKYVEFGSGNARNSVISALHFIAQYWGFGLIPLAIGLLLSSLFIQYGKNNRAPKSAGKLAIQNAVSVLLIATAATLFYVVFGADDLSMPYICLFYFAVPIATIALVIGFIFLSIKPLTQWIFVLALVFFALLFVYRQASFSPDYAGQYANPEIPKYFNKVASLDTKMLALDLDNHESWEALWSTLLGIEVYAARHGRPDLFCINRHWQIAFMEKTRCSPEQLKTSQRLIVSAAPEAIGIFGESLIALGNIHFYKFQPLRTPNLRLVDVASNKTLFTVGLLQDGWSAVSEDFAWSEGKVANLSFELEASRHISAIELDIAAFLPLVGSTQSAKIIINGVYVDAFHFTEANNRAVRKLTLPVELQRSTTMNIELHIESPTSPKQAGISTDPRKLGVALYGIKLEGAVQ